MTQTYIGRFAPSPTGPLHFGSLVCALASYLDAKIHQGRWLVRLEDIDPPREMPGASDCILRSLEHHGLFWDAPLVRQSQRHEAYKTTLTWLYNQGLTYPCNCSRKRLEALGDKYDGYCLTHPPTGPTAWRIQVASGVTVSFSDRHLGPQHAALGKQGDFIIHRKDGLYAYTLAVVVDDWQQGITQVVRGSDLLEATGRQIYLFNLLNTPAPNYCHIPVVTNEAGQKLSKQNLAPALNNSTPSENLWRALWALGAKPALSLKKASVSDLLTWGQANWQIEQLPPGPQQPQSALPE